MVISPSPSSPALLAKLQHLAAFRSDRRGASGAYRRRNAKRTKATFASITTSWNSSARRPGRFFRAAALEPDPGDRATRRATSGLSGAKARAGRRGHTILWRSPAISGACGSARCRGNCSTPARPGDAAESRAVKRRIERRGRGATPLIAITTRQWPPDARTFSGERTWPPSSPWKSPSSSRWTIRARCGHPQEPDRRRRLSLFWREQCGDSCG